MSEGLPNLVADRYRLMEPLGQGGMGRVWKARDEVLHRDVAIKELVPPPGLTTDERREMRERSLREARAIARLNNINVVRIFDVLRTHADPWIVMEYVPSRSLQDTLATDGPVSATRAAEIGLGVLGALKAAHRSGVMHRDVKPGNVLLGEDGRVVLTDFGLATVPGDPNVTRTGLVLGSPAYIAPERARDGTAGPEGDLWSLGATLYAAVEGQSPFARSSAIATLAALATEQVPPSKRAGPLKAVLNGLLRKDPASRIDAATAERLLRRAAGRRSRPGLSLLDGVRRPSPHGPRPERTKIVPLPAQRPPQDRGSAPVPPPPPVPAAPPAPSADVTELVTPAPPRSSPAAAPPAEPSVQVPEQAGAPVPENAVPRSPATAPPSTDQSPAAESVAPPPAEAPTEQAPADQSSAAPASAVQPSAEQAAAAQASVDQAPVDQAPTDQAPADQALAEQAPADQSSAGQASAVQSPGEQAVTAQAPAADQAPAEQAAADQETAPAPVDRASGADQASAEQVTVGRAAGGSGTASVAPDQPGVDAASADAAAATEADAAERPDGEQTGTEPRTGQPGDSGRTSGAETDAAAGGSSPAPVLPMVPAVVVPGPTTGPIPVTSSATRAVGAGEESPTLVEPAIGTGSTGDAGTPGLGAPSRDDAARADTGRADTGRGDAGRPAGPARGTALLTAMLPGTRRSTDDDWRTRLAAVPRRIWLVGAAIVLLLLALVVVVPLANRDEPGTTTGSEPTAGPTSGPAAPPAPTDAPSPTATAAPTEPAPPPAGDPTGRPDPVAPAGWELHRDESGFVVPYPKGWNISQDGSIVYFREPNGRRWFLIDQTRTPEDDPVADWTSKEAHRRSTTSGYQRVGQIRAVNYFLEAADWEWTYNSDNGNRRHTRNRGFVTASDQAYAIRWDTLASDWQENLANFQIIADNFRPARG